MEGGAVRHNFERGPGFGLNWFSGFRGEDLNVKVYMSEDDNRRQVVAKAHIVFGYR